MKTVCKKCLGLGWIPNPKSPIKFAPLTCDACGGSGIVENSNFTKIQYSINIKKHLPLYSDVNHISFGGNIQIGHKAPVIKEGQQRPKK